MKDCIIVCGYPTNEDGTMSSILQSRVDKAIQLYQDHHVRYLIFSGGSVHNQYNEALTMKKYAMDKGIPEEVILLEDQAISTYHNMKYAKNIMDENNLKNCYVITNSWHIVKAKYYARKFHFNFQMVSASKPDDMRYIQVFFLHIYMPINMFINRLKGYY